MKKNVILSVAAVCVLIAALAAAGFFAHKASEAERRAEASEAEAAALETALAESDAARSSAETEAAELRETLAESDAENEALLDEAAETGTRLAAIEAELDAARLAESVRENHTVTENEYATANLPTFRYLLYEPNGEITSEGLPLLVFLHGSGGSGQDLRLLYADSTLPSFLTDGWLSPNALVLMPQCPGDSWDAIHADLMELIEYVAETKGADSERISITGFSLGGMGCFSMLTHYPEYFSAAAPLASKWNPSSCNVITSTPVHIYHGEFDEVMENSVTQIRAVINDAGGQCELTIYPGEGHMIQQHYMDDGGAIVAWLTAQHRDT